MKTNAAILLIGLSAALSTAQVQAATDTTQFDVTITIEPSCNISTEDNGVSPLAFGSHDSFQTDVLGQTSLTVTCTTGAEYDLGLNAGQHASTPDDVNTRRMQGVSTTPADNQADFVPYQLYQNSDRSTVWGNTIGTDTFTSTGTGATQSHNIYGKVPSTNYTVGDYKDTVTATVTF